MNRNFLLTTPCAERLYEEYAKNMPIIDYHNHLPHLDIVSDRHFGDIAELWILSDPYKHRLMRICGVDEEYITGRKTSYEKFVKWCEIFPRLVGTPVFHWSLAELSEVFGIEEFPSAQTAPSIWEKANTLLECKEYSAMKILKKFNVEYCAPCTEITDDVSFFEKLEVFAPSLRGDSAVSPSPNFINKLGNIKNLTEYKGILKERIAAFTAAGCRFSDHALDNGFTYEPDDHKNSARFDALLSGAVLPPQDKVFLASEILRYLASLYNKAGWTMQLHIGAERVTSPRLREIAGPAGGYATVGETVNLSALIGLFSDLEKTDSLPKTLLFTLNPTDNVLIATLSGSFANSHDEALISQGPAWWWCDHLHGTREMLENFAAHSVLSTFVGMTTDSRNVLSFIRHDYFRRTLCGWVGEKVKNGEFPSDTDMLGNLIKQLCYNNAKKRLTEV